MAEEKLIDTRTDISTTGSNISIFTYYFKAQESYLQFFVPQIDGATGGVNFIAGDLGYTIENLGDIFSINELGELIVSSIYSEKYSINSEGDLIYTE